MSTSVAETLDRAADLIEERGWHRGIEVAGNMWSVGGGGSLCLEGGIMAAAGLTTTFEMVRECPAYDAVWSFLQSDQRWGLFRDRLYDWNDVHGRTAAEVVGVLRAVAVVEAARESVAVAS